MLKFLGSGGAFNTDRGNNCAYFKLGTELFILDCGEDVFKKLIKYNLFHKVSRVNFFITHLHGDHVGSLSTTIAYLFFVQYNQNKSKINVFHPSHKIEELLKLQGMDLERYTLYINDWDKIKADGYQKKLEYSFEKNEHDPKLDSFSIEFNIKDEVELYYSGDTNKIKDKIKNIWNYDYVYHEITMIENSTAHSDYQKLLEMTKEWSDTDKKKIWLMHLDEGFDVDKAKANGFNVVENEYIEDTK